MRITTVGDLAGAIRLSRRERGWTQADLAQRAGVSRDLVSRLENGSERVEVGKVLDIVAALGLTTAVAARPAPFDLTAIVRAHQDSA